MKEIILPIPSENTINIAEIDTTFEGVIVCKNDEKTLGVILYDSDDSEWVFIKSIDIADKSDFHFNLLELIKEISYKFKNTKFFVL